MFKEWFGSSVSFLTWSNLLSEKIRNNLFELIVLLFDFSAWRFTYAEIKPIWAILSMQKNQDIDLHVLIKLQAVYSTLLEVFQK